LGGGTTVSGGVLNGKAIELPAPPYPAVARAVKASGTVTVQVTVDEQGRVVSANAVGGHPLVAGGGGRGGAAGAVLPDPAFRQARQSNRGRHLQF
jgi:hypothetical protein